MFQLRAVLFIFMLGGVCLCDETNVTFQPTKEWKTVEEGQAIPQGLHVRINLQTGQKEAKLLDNKGEKKALSEVKNHQDTEENQTLDPAELKKIMKNIKPDDVFNEDIKSKYKSYVELKKDFESLKIKVETDTEILHGLIDNYKKFDHDRKSKPKHDNLGEFLDGELISILTDLEYLVHQIDNAREFARIGGITEIVHNSLNSTNEEIRSEALKLHGSATQSNPLVQIAALESGSINIILKTLALDKDLTVRSRAVYALSCLLRRFPLAQSKLIQDGGLTVFALIFDKEGFDSLKLQLKITTLINDLLTERKETKLLLLEEESRNRTSVKYEELEEKMKQYKMLDLETKLVEQKWCSRISKWFVQQNHKREDSDIKNDFKSAFSSEIPIRNQHDAIEKIVETIFTLSDICKHEFKEDEELIILLYNLKSVYLDLAAKENTQKQDDNYFSGISNILNLLTSKFRPPRIKEEL